MAPRTDSTSAPRAGDDAPADAVVTREVVVPAERADVWEALTSEELLERWLAPHVELDPCEGGAVHVRYDDGEERDGTVETVDAGERFAFRWERIPGEESTVEFRLADAPAGTRVVVVETGARSVGPRALGMQAAPMPAAAGGATAWRAPLARLHALARAGIPVLA